MGLRHLLPAASTGKMLAHAKHSIELRDLDILMAVTEAGSFRKAAMLLALEPSAISRRIRTLEDRLVASLFERTRSGVKLTEAGRVFRLKAGGVIEHLDDAIRSIASAGHAGSGKIGLGVVGSLSYRYLGQLIRMYRLANPGVILSVKEGSTRDHLAAINDRSLDIAFVLAVPRLRGYDMQRLWSEPVLAALPADDARTAHGRLSLQLLAEDQFILSSDSPGPEIHDYLIRSLSDLNSRLMVSRYRVGREVLIQMVGLGFGISLICGSEMSLLYPHVKLVPLDSEEIPFSAIWSPQNDNPALRRFLSLARQLSYEEQNDTALKTPGLSP